MENQHLKKHSSLCIPCPSCKKEIFYDLKNLFRPFCSERCQKKDLASWAEEDYKVAVQVHVKVENEPIVNP